LAALSLADILAASGAQLSVQSGARSSGAGFSTMDAPFPIGAEGISPKSRRFSRKSVVFASAQVGEAAAGLILNISEGGLCLLAAQELVTDRLVRVRFQSLEARGWIEAQGRIAWTDQTKNVAGLAFVDMSEEARREVRNWLSFSDSLRELRDDWASSQTPARRTFENNPDFASLRGVDTGTGAPEYPGSRAITQDALRPAGYATAPDSAADDPSEASAIRETNYRRLRVAASVTVVLLLVPVVVAIRRLHPLRLVASRFAEKRAASLAIPDAARASPVPPAFAIPVQTPASALPQNIVAPNHVPATNPPGQTEENVQLGFQVAAMSAEENANQLAESLRGKNFPTVVSRKPGQHLYRVLVGPYPDKQSARQASAALEREQMHPILKRWTS
jgi:cell division septation protein DedD